MIMAAAKALTIVDRWEVGGGRERERKEGLAAKEDGAKREKK